jgi:hypothetical protein
LRRPQWKRETEVGAARRQRDPPFSVPPDAARFSDSIAPSYALGIATQAPPAAWMRLHNCSATARVGAGRRTW